MDFCEKIKALRHERGLTLENVGDMVGVGKSTVRKWENGQIANMRRDKISLLAKALGVSPSYLMGWSDDDSVSSNQVDEMEIAFSSDELKLVDLYRSLNQRGQTELMFQAESFAGREDFKANALSAKAM